MRRTSENAVSLKDVNIPRRQTEGDSLPSTQYQRSKHEKLFPCGQLQLPDKADWRREDHEVEDDVDRVRANEEVFQVDTHAPVTEWVPCFGDGDALEDGTKQSC